ncbi:hypothetical protein XA68_10131 [Ophiocordyceps unilateralis]|uniref:GATA-type domain-containing protein n=1 Tax=Ophiocordyceps unilateralis TaxID=268505 RepID=A0A2A9P2V2_OPHUN|nr:hypothetical protein XA68_10131 [Ophiocordyceps unilateralis]
MATATVLAPSAHYPSQPSYSLSAYSPHPPPPAMIAADARRPSDDETPVRQSLPSISEVISGARPGQYPPPSQTAIPPPGVALPSPFSQPAHQYPEADKHASPFPPRQDGLSVFVDSPRPPFSGRHSLPPVADRRATPPTKADLPHPHVQKPPPDAHAPNGTYSHPPPPAPTSHPYQPGQLPPGQVPLPSYPISPRHAVPVPPGHYDPRAQAAHLDEVDFANRTRFEAPLNRHFETWSYQDSLSRIGSSSRTIYTFAEAYMRIAREQHGSQPIPERLPTEREVIEMLVNVDLIKRSLDQVKDAIQASIQSERAREGAKMKSSTYEGDHDVPMYGDVMKPQYAMQHEVKKRRGRAAPPGRCHSCNRIDTPEWRRGPDGARTLCNACGLHYAKLERKRQLEARSIRPKPEDRS